MSSDLSLIPESQIERSPIDYDNPFFADDMREMGILNVHSQIWRYTRWLPAICDRLYLILLHDAQDPKRPRSVKELADAAGVSKDTIVEATRALEYVNMIRVVRDDNRHTLQKQHNRYQALPAHQWKMLSEKYDAKSIEISRSKKSTSEGRKNRLKSLSTSTVLWNSSFTTLQNCSRAAPSGEGLAVEIEPPKNAVNEVKAVAASATIPLFDASTTPAPTQALVLPVTESEKTSPALVKNFTPEPGMLVWYAKGESPLPALVLSVRKNDVVIIRMSHGQIVNHNVTPSRLKIRASADEHDPSLQAHASAKHTASEEHKTRAELMDAWKKATNGAYGATGFDIGSLVRAKGGIFGQLAKLNLTPEQVGCAGALYKAWWDMQKPVLKPDVASMVIAIRLAVNLCDRKYTPENVRTAMNALMLEPFWKGKPVPFDQVATRLPTLLATPGNHTNKPKLNQSDITYGSWLRWELIKIEDKQADSYTLKQADHYRKELRELIERGLQLAGRIPKGFES